ncbi:Hypothetical predicted protein [Pelobates cultripes]|uniref:Uncharacterized protein n=1 Tax=Pelobates cultripes TaxID=61616 RepID=A0AAD1VPF9_PELCU|nr:Hypothetical predicted protein [Pelobates cultripes]
MCALRDKTTNFYQDLTWFTLQWRHTMRPITWRFQHASIPYRWSIPRALTVQAARKYHKITSPDDASKFLTALGIADTTHETQKPPQGHRWDVPNVRPFIPSMVQDSMT